MIHIPPSRETSDATETALHAPIATHPGRRETRAMAVRMAALVPVAPAPLAVSLRDAREEA